MSIAREYLSDIQKAQLKHLRPDIDWKRVETTSGREVDIRKTKKGEYCDNRLPQGG